MTAQHTPGPWVVSGRNMNDIRDKANGIVACAFHIRYPTHDRPTWETRANARRLAAAPDLLEALQEFVRNPGGDYTEANALAAIAKATGVSDV